MTAPECPYDADDQVEYAYGEMDEKSAAAFRAHLESCSSCRAAVSELEEAARLVKRVREAPVPPAQWKKTFDVSRVEERPAWWRRPVFWVPVATAACALIVLVILTLPQKPQAPVKPPPDAVPLPVPVKELPTAAARVIRTTGEVTVRHGDEVARIPLTVEAKLLEGDTLVASAKSMALLELDDESRILLGAKSTLRLESLGPGGDLLQLSRGQAACRICARDENRPCMLEVGFSRVEVTGTLFAVRLVNKKRLIVGVHQGSVRVSRKDRPDISVDVRAGAQATLLKNNDRINLSNLSPMMRKIMQPLLPEAKPETPQPRAPEDRPQQPGDRQETTPKEPPKKEGKAKPERATPENIAALVERMYKDTRWIFDDLRADIARGQWDVVLHRLENYLADPESPNRDEAVFLKAVCLEKLDRRKEAHQTYRDYLLKWPAGRRAPEAKHGLIRTRAGR